MNSIIRQRGVAIITALLIVAIATTVSVTISTRLQLDVRRTGNIIAGDQASQIHYRHKVYGCKYLYPTLAPWDEYTESIHFCL